ncbi:hypothetical protein EPIB2_352 [Tritonibacter mobilis]|uniref:hypothetical protein n=2 Tax=Tritonibacter mobilis TaxID=379347 RepID=UPI000AB5B217|nr:hypothetical protein [Tritonibacter mobilis]VCU61275.1 hypothetical protein EPIB2_352 [Tritonibacter mobilis]
MMANSFLGETEVSADGKIWKLRCDFNAMIAFQEATGMDALDAFEGVEEDNVDFVILRHIMHAFLQHHHEDASLKDAGSVLSADLDAVSRVIASASPELDEGDTAGNGPAVAGSAA